MIIATWTGIGILVLLNIIGWFFAYNRYSRNESRHLGRIEGKVDGLNGRMQSLEERLSTLENRLDGLLTNPGDSGD